MISIFHASYRSILRVTVRDDGGTCSSNPMAVNKQPFYFSLPQRKSKSKLLYRTDDVVGGNSVWACVRQNLAFSSKCLVMDTNEMWHGEVKWIRNLPSSLDRYKAERSVGWREKTPTTISYLILRKYISYDRLNRRIFNTITGHPFSRSSMCVRTENGT